MMIAVIGKNGQLAWELKRLASDRCICLGREDIDLSDKSAIQEKLEAREITAVINASAYTAVDKAESDEEAARALNVTAVKNLAEYCREKQLQLVHCSTDYVFDGEKGAPYAVDDKIEPQGVYGKTKAEGEQALQAILPDRSTIIRTSWVYSAHGNNFVKTMLRLMAEKPALTIIDDQIGSPTWAKGLAEACLEAVDKKITGVYHWSDEGVCSWYDFALAIQQLGRETGLLDTAIPVAPIPTEDYPTPAKRPHYSVLDKTLTRKTFSDATLTHWRQQLSAMMNELK
ncbi:dTDP-4-dehydrorhamnose reductase [Alteromonas sp. ASW11-19]|uniref:dTDP-4-dehydrorhamnose reductase n=1 Tax=Alteromonas salexigens TaxID=2982530 RepID=A0ABT2VNI4_9ALTE|nr:dTDP-4-dehydrorhamnose reductase [Alteromonas salexigens]MCU7554432.1 dTDP-4-dehydrorhamnose reductase [Alteromonas salexigens]